ncbi:hypothetical protein [Kitasatospora sp. NBC_00039]|uniref:hypothetical protein n=1 Tax=Kitasatospora sp. NBC_00039 TaxID=2903565 RepID=UPI002F90A044
MTGSDTGRYGDAYGQGHDEPVDTEVERELRVLLQRAAPDLPAPDDRMDRVRERVARTLRRRRTAALAAGLTTGLVAAALAAAPALAPGPSATVLRPATTAPPLPGAPAAPAPTLATDAPGPVAGAVPTSVPGAATSESPAPEVSARPLRFPDLGGVTVDLPAGWSSTAVPAAEPRASTGYVASEPLDPKPSCGPQQSSCGPVGRLAGGGALVTITLVGDQDMAEKLAGGRAVVETDVDKSCGLRGGTRQVVGHRIVDVANAAAVVELTACLNRPSGQTVQQVQHILDSVRTTGDAPTAPGSTRG